ncbi:nitroreductase family protein [Micromonospora sagamiensis]|uniref:Nitroreductase n=1 Tax=Micromonospora sagamiensis TaxID=47875 RepID=A0A562WFT4_9ACTN|nr:nitroreductase family protein [Micromonospora sagamiensis]TWJ29076.1 nitroreductase [Micromonospora sagamiensis]BCL17899.1 nitroreductase [Micromonospora sagamiensis]
MTYAKSADTPAPLHPLLAGRWSPRSFDPTHHLDDAVLRPLLEAARWAPSANNSQPWRFLVTRRDEDAFTRLHATLNPGNQVWADAASALLLVAARTVDDTGQQRPFALYDTGQAVAHLVLQAQAHGLATHQMGGFDATAVRAAFDLDGDLQPVVVLAVGRADAATRLPAPLAAREEAPRVRQPLDALLLSPARVATG